MKIWQRFSKKKKEETKQEERFILCIDGGGMRGVIPIAILKALEDKIKAKGFDKPLASYFDLIAGTSTGGLISLVLSYTPEVTLDSLSNTYMTSGSTIFPEDDFPFSRLRKLFVEKYPVNGIEEVLSQWFRDKKMDEAKVPTMVVSYDLSIGEETLIRSWKNTDFYVREAGRATSAAPTFFAPMEKGSSILADGGVIANNPSVYAYYEAKKLYPNCKKFHILSVSTAGKSHKMQGSQASGLLSWAEDIVPMYSTAQKRLIDYVMYNNKEVSYIRIDGQMGKNIKMDDISEQALLQMKEYGESLAKDYDQVLEYFANCLTEDL